MARSTDYITNDIGFKSPYDIIINDIGLNFFGDTPVKGRFGPGELDKSNATGEYPIIFNDFSNGMGMAYSGVKNTYAYSINGYARTRRKFMPGGKLTEIDLTDIVADGVDNTAEIRCGLEWGGDIYIGIGHHIVKIASGYLAPTVEYNVGANCQIDSALVYNNIPLFSTDQSFDNWQYLTGHDGVAWKTANADGTDLTNYTVRTGAGNYDTFPRPVYLEKMKKFFQEVDGVGGNRIVGNDSFFTTIQTQSSNIDEVIGDESVYSSAIQIGDSTYPITGIYESNRMFIVTKVDGVYGVETGGVYTPNYTPTWREAPSYENGKVGIFFQGRFFAGMSDGVEMININDKQRIDIPERVSPGHYLANETPIFGIPTAMVADSGWVACSLWNGADSHLCYFMPRDRVSEDNPMPVVWHGSECTIPGEKITFMMKTQLTNADGSALQARMLIGTYDYTNSRCHLYLLSLPTSGDPYTDYLNGDEHEFATECRLYLPFQDAEDPNAKKFVRRYDTQADGLTFPDANGDIVSAGELDFYANADAGSRIFFETVEPSDAASEWQYQGVVTTSPKASMIPTSAATSGSQIGILIVGRLVNQGSVAVPIYSPFAIRSVKIRADIIVDQIEIKTYTVGLGHLGSTITGRDHGDMDQKYAFLIALQDQDAVYMIDEHGDRVLVKVEPGMQYYLKREESRSPYTYIVEFEVSYIGRQFIYDVGHAFDSVYAWGS